MDSGAAVRVPVSPRKVWAVMMAAAPGLASSAETTCAAVLMMDPAPFVLMYDRHLGAVHRHGEWGIGNARVGEDHSETVPAFMTPGPGLDGDATRVGDAQNPLREPAVAVRLFRKEDDLCDGDR